MNERSSRVDAEWVALNAFRGLIRVATGGDDAKSTYNNALDLGTALYPELLGPEASVLRQERESRITTEYRQEAELRSMKEKRDIAPLDLVRADIKDLQDLLAIKRDKKRVDALKRKLNALLTAERELDPISHTENQLIFRDVYSASRDFPVLQSGRGHRDFELPEGKILRVRVLHPDKPEHITGADVVYERHDLANQTASLVAVQYKIWEERALYLSTPRMKAQLKRLASFMCESSACAPNPGSAEYRFPHCAAFLRLTDRLQTVNHKFVSTGEHLPICRIGECQSDGPRGGAMLTYDRIKETSLTSDMFELLFNRGKIGSRMLCHDELARLYTDYLVESAENNVVIYAQEF